eukprot:253345-Rhodomonas_salina.1
MCLRACGAECGTEIAYCRAPTQAAAPIDPSLPACYADCSIFLRARAVLAEPSCAICGVWYCDNV